MLISGRGRRLVRGGEAARLARAWRCSTGDYGRGEGVRGGVTSRLKAGPLSKRGRAVTEVEWSRPGREAGRLKLATFANYSR